MIYKIVCKNLKRDRAVSVITVLFITAAAGLLSLAVILACNLSGSIDQLMASAKTPHFMQMHTGEIDMEKLDTFSRQEASVEEYQILSFLGIDNSEIILGTHSLSEDLQDNGFCTQSKIFDFLLDMQNQPAEPENGQLYVPVSYYKAGFAKMGDRASVGGKDFVIAGFVRDSQMNSSLASSKRFLVSETDYKELQSLGTVEYLIEFRLNDLSDLNEFETAYSRGNLPSNGPTLTWPLFKMMSAISDGLLIALITMVSLLVILIALLCIRFTLLARLENDYREIGVMKAVGLRISHIRESYLVLYAFMAAFGSGLGYLLSLWIREPMQRGIQLNLGGISRPWDLAMGASGAVLVFFFVLFYVNIRLGYLNKISAVQALHFGGETDSAAKGIRLRLSKNRFLPVNLFLGFKDVLQRTRLYLTMLAVILLSSFLMIVPQNLYTTISDDHFITYMGVGKCDMRLDLQGGDQKKENMEQIETYLRSDSEVASYAAFTTKAFSVNMEDGRTETLKIELGNHNIFPLQYVKGTSPKNQNEIALSSLNADELGLGIGDEITIQMENGNKKLAVCGIFSDITNGGKVAKASFQTDLSESAWSMVYITLKDPSQLGVKISEYSKQFGFAKVSDIDEYVAQTFGQTLRAVRGAAFISGFVALFLTFLITLLFMRLLISKDRYSIAAMRAMGFTPLDIRWQYGSRSLAVLVAGILAGSLLASTLGERLAAMAISVFGAATFRFTADPLYTYLISPVTLLLGVLTATVFGTKQAGGISICETIKE